MGTGTGAPVGGGAAPAYAGGAGYGVGGGQGTGTGTGPPTGFDGVASPYHHHVSNAGGAQGGSRLLVVALRAIAAVLALVCVGVSGAAKQTVTYLDSNGEAFSVSFVALHLAPFKFVFGAVVIVLVYELVQIVLIFVAYNAVARYAGALPTFVFDQILAYLVFAAGASTATLIVVYRNGDGVNDNRVCDDFSINSLCSKAEAVSAMAFVTFLILAVLAFTSSRKVVSTLRS